MRLRVNLVFSVLTALEAGSICRAAPGDLDTSFGVTGSVLVSDGPNNNDNTRAVVVQPDGKILVGGSSQSGVNSDYSILRFLPNGALDTSFGSNGQFRLDLGFADGSNAMALQPDGKIIVGGPDLLRLNPNGSLDASFGVNGHISINAATQNRLGGVSSLAILPNGRILIGSSSLINSSANKWNFVVGRFSASGSLDSTFGSNGLAMTSFDAGKDILRSLAVQSDGKILGFGNDVSDLALVRYLPNGSIDPTFGNGGTVTADLGGTRDQAAGIVIQKSGKIVVGGNLANNFGDGLTFNLIRYLPDGSVDPTFGINGEESVHTPFATRAQALLVDQNDNLFLTSDSAGTIAGFSPDGSLLADFGKGGITSGALDRFDSGSTAAFTPNYKIIIGGEGRVGSTLGFLAAQFEGEPVESAPEPSGIAWLSLGWVALKRRRSSPPKHEKGKAKGSGTRKGVGSL